MKTFLFLTFISVFSYFSFSQRAINFKDAEKLTISISYLDSIYPSGFHVDTSIAVFKNNPEEFYQAYQNLLQSLGKFLKTNEFYWKETTKAFNRIYFNKDGKIDYFLFNFNENQLSYEEEKRFEDLLNKFINEYQFPLTADSNFAQCSGAVYQKTLK